MTFYEAALRVLESAGKPLHVQEITAQSISQSLLSHVGKMPEQTMLSRLAAMARRNRDRKVIVTAKDTFALVEWDLPEDADALALTGVAEPNPEEDLPPYRPVERHPESRTENVRSSGRGEKGRRRGRDEDEDDRRSRKRRYPPVPEVCFEILSDSAEALKASEIIEKARSRELCGEELSDNALLTHLLEDNQRRIDAGRRPQFIFNKDTMQVSLERAGAPSEVPSAELQAAFAAALGIPLENGRPVLPRRDQPSSAIAAASPEDLATVTGAKAQVKEARRSMGRVLRKRLAEMDAFQLEKACSRMLTELGFRELKVAKRNNLGPLLTARRREGSVELRYAIRLIKGTPGIDRKSVQDVRRDIGHYAAQVGILLSAGDVRGDGRSEAQSNGPLAMVWCGDALADKFLEAKAGVKVELLEFFELDESFFDAVKVEGAEAEKRREERIRDRDSKGDRPERPERAERPERKERPPRAEHPDSITDEHPAVAAAPSDVVEPPAVVGAIFGEAEEGDEGGGDDEGGDDDLEAAADFVGEGKPGEAGAPGAPGQPGSGRKRRRRRRGRRGRGRGEPGAPGAPGAQGAAPTAEGTAAAPSPEAAPPPPPPPPAPSSGDAQ